MPDVSTVLIVLSLLLVWGIVLKMLENRDGAQSGHTSANKMRKRNRKLRFKLVKLFGSELLRMPVEKGEKLIAHMERLILEGKKKPDQHTAISEQK